MEAKSKSLEQLFPYFPLRVSTSFQRFILIDMSFCLMHSIHPVRYPAIEWIVLGNFTAQNMREIQYFPLKEPAWVK